MSTPDNGCQQCELLEMSIATMKARIAQLEALLAARTPTKECQSSFDDEPSGFCASEVARNRASGFEDDEA